MDLIHVKIRDLTDLSELILSVDPSIQGPRGSRGLLFADWDVGPGLTFWVGDRRLVLYWDVPLYFCSGLWMMIVEPLSRFLDALRGRRWHQRIAVEISEIKETKQGPVARSCCVSSEDAVVDIARQFFAERRPIELVDGYNWEDTTGFAVLLDTPPGQETSGPVPFRVPRPPPRWKYPLCHVSSFLLVGIVSLLCGGLPGALLGAGIGSAAGGSMAGGVGPGMLSGTLVAFVAWTIVLIWRGFWS
jgi:hypothetical protein